MSLLNPYTGCNLDILEHNSLYQIEIQYKSHNEDNYGVDAAQEGITQQSTTKKS